MRNLLDATSKDLQKEIYKRVGTVLDVPDMEMAQMGIDESAYPCVSCNKFQSEDHDEDEYAFHVRCRESAGVESRYVQKAEWTSESHAEPVFMAVGVAGSVSPLP